jgi:hypothetical protein
MSVKNPPIKNLPQPPSLITSLMGGFDSVANHIFLIAFPVIFDLFLWLGPRLRISRIIYVMLDQFQAASAEAMASGSPEMVDMIKSTRAIWELIAERANLFTALRTYPVGVASLMAARLPIDNPLGTSTNIELSMNQFFGAWLMLTIIGLVFGTLYFYLTAEAAVHNKTGIFEGIQFLPSTLLQVIWLTILLALVLIVVSVPVMLFFSVIILIVGNLGQYIVLLLTGLLLWLMLPLLFTPHGIFVNHQKVLQSFWRGIRFAQFTLPKTSLFILIGIVISQGLDLLWQIPPESSWMSLIGIFGHAFVFTGILAASFIYYQQSEKWVQEMLLLRAAAQSGNQSGNQAV